MTLSIFVSHWRWPSRAERRGVRFGWLALLALLLVAVVSAEARAAPAAHDWRPVVLPQAAQLDLESAVTGRRYRIFVGVPAIPPPPHGYPVLYVLDGNASFPVAALMSRNVGRRSSVSGVGPALVVGIGYAGDEDFHVAERAGDYTPAAGEGVRARGGRRARRAAPTASSISSSTNSSP